MVGSFGKEYILSNGRYKTFSRFPAAKLWAEIEMQVFARLPKSAISTTLKTDLLNAFEWNVSPEETTVIAGKQTDTLEFSLFCIALVSLFEIELSKALLEEYVHNCIGYYIARE